MKAHFPVLNRTWRRHTSIQNSRWHPYIACRWVEVDIDVGVLNAHDPLVLEDLVGHSRFEGGTELHQTSTAILVFHSSYYTSRGVIHHSP